MTENERIQLIQAIEQAEAVEDLERCDSLHKELRRLGTPDPEMTARHARVAFMLGDKARAATITRKALRQDPDNAKLQMQLADVYYDQKRKEEALKCYRRVIEVDPDNVAALRRASQMLQERPDGRPEALGYLEHAIVLAPEDPAVWLQIGAIYAMEDNDYERAEAAFHKALEFAPNTPSAYHNLGLLRRFQGDLETAEKYLLQACERHPNESDFAFSLGSCYYFMEDTDNALKWYRRAIEINPNNTAAYVYEAYVLLLQGNWAEGWQAYEARRRLDVLKDTNYLRPEWDGSDLGGETLLITCEQGMGDNLQFIRYAGMVSERGCRVIVVTHKPLMRLFESLEGVSMVVNALPEPKYFHRYATVMSLPLRFDTQPDTVPENIPYLHASDDLIAAWGEKLAEYEGVKVGLCWRGNPQHVNDRFRSSSMTQISQLLEIPGITFFSLHKDRPEYEQDLPDGLIDIGTSVEDFADTAAIMEHLDVVISVDTSVCHLAGAIGANAWTLIPRGPDFRWGLDSDKTPWYPSMKLYRQDTLGDWDPVLDRIGQDLRSLVDDKA